MLPKRVADTELKTPLKLPMGVRAALTMTTFLIGVSSSTPLRAPHDDPAHYRVQPYFRKSRRQRDPLFLRPQLKLFEPLHQKDHTKHALW
jgi:hypothetical protein